MTDIILKKYIEECKYIRDSYPGWLVAPSKNRFELEYYSSQNRNLGYYPISDILVFLFNHWHSNNLQDWKEFSEPEDQIYFIETFIWSLEIGLHRLYPPLPIICEKLITAIDPFGFQNLSFLQIKNKHEISNKPGSLTDIVANNPNLFSPNSRFKEEAHKEFLSSKNPYTLSQKWTKIALALLKNYRQNRILNKWENLYSLLSQTLTQSDDLAFIKYEACLLKLSNWQYEDINSLLKEWPEDTNDPYWLTRKAIMHAQIDQFEQRERLFQKSLQRIRQMDLITSQPYYASSREIWTQYLYTFSSPLNKRDKYHNDLAQVIKTNKLDPYHEVNFFSDSYQSTKNAEAFDPFELPALEPSSWGEDTEKPYKLFNFSEFLGIHASIKSSDNQYTNFFSKSREQSAFKLSPIDPKRQQWELFACGDIEIIQRFLTRSKVISLDKDFVDHWWDRSLTLYNQQYQLTKTPNQDDKRFCLSMEVISRLALRQDKKTISDLLSKFLSNWDERRFPIFNYVEATYFRLLKRLIALLKIEDLEPHLEKIITFPHRETSNSSPDPFYYLAWNSELQKSPEIQKITHNLLNQCDISSPDLPLLKLLWLLERNCIDEADQQKIADFIWRTPDKPFFPKIPLWALIRFPEKINGQAKEWLRKILLDMNLPILPELDSNITTNPNDNQQYGWTTWFEIIRKATKPSKITVKRDKKVEKIYIDWTEEEAKIILDKITLWWEKNKENLESRIKLAPPYEDIRCKYYMREVILTLAGLIASRLPHDDTTPQKLIELWQSMKQAGIYTLPLETSLIRFSEYKDTEETQEKIQLFLLNATESELKNNQDRIKIWSFHQLANKMPEIPQTFIDIISIRLINSLPNSDLSLILLEMLHYTLDDCPNENKDLNYPCMALKAFYGKTQYRADQHIENLHTIRWWCVKLAITLKNSSQEEIPEVMKWIEEAKSDPLPEINQLTI